MYVGFTKEIGMSLTARDLEKIGALIENSESRLGGRIDGLGERFDRLETRFDGLETRFDGLDARFDVLETRFDGLETRFDGLETRIDRMETRLLYSIELIQRDGFGQLEDHERRIKKLEKIQTR